MKHRLSIDSKGNLKIWRRRQGSQDEPQKAATIATADDDGAADWVQLQANIQGYLEKSLASQAGASKDGTEGQ